MAAPSAGQGAEELGLYADGGDECKMVQPSGNGLPVSLKTKHAAVIQPSKLHSWAFIPGKEKHIHTNSCTRMFPLVVFIVASNWKEPSCPSVGEWLEEAVVPRLCGTLTTQQEQGQTTGSQNHLDGPPESQAE